MMVLRTRRHPVRNRLSAGEMDSNPRSPGDENGKSRALGIRSDRGHYRRRGVRDPQHQQGGQQAIEAARHERQQVISAKAAHRAGAKSGERVDVSFQMILRLLFHQYNGENI
jgi:hypothetical protein